MFARDPAWAAYLIADLDPPLAQHATWFADPDAGAVVLLYRALGIPILTALGPADACAPLWREAFTAIGGAPRLFAVCRPEHRSFVDRTTPFEEAVPMFRMRLEGSPLPSGPTDRLVAADLPALNALYADGAKSGESPDFFDASMIAHGLYHGVRDEHGRVAAVAGTHVLSGGVAAIGNVYTRRDARGRGYAARATAAVCAGLRARGVTTIVLNVRQDNAVAIRVYERLGFVVHGPFVEGFARPAAPA